MREILSDSMLYIRRKIQQKRDCIWQSYRKGLSSYVSMEHTGFEPVASTMRMLRAPNCANAPGVFIRLLLYADLIQNLIYHKIMKMSLYFSTFIQSG